MAPHAQAEARRRRAAHDRQMAAKVDVNTVSVLLDTGKLTDAAQIATKGGKKRINGLYLPNGTKCEESADHNRVQGSAVSNEEAQQDLNLNRVAKTYNSRMQAKQKRMEKLKKTEDDVDDEIPAQKAEKILSKSTEHERIMYQELFNFFDVDKDRTWGSIEFAQRMTDIGCNTSVESASNLLYFAGVRDVDRITYNDFLLLMPKLKAFRKLLEKDAMRHFAAKDVNGTGYLSLKQLRDVIIEIAGPGGIEDIQVEQILKKADRERTGKIPFAFFIRALFGTPPLLQYKPEPRRTTLFALIFGCGARSAARNDLDDDDADSTL